MKSFLLFAWGVIVGLLLAALLLSWRTALADEPVCTSHSEMLAALADRYHETSAAIGIENRGALLELLISKDGATWSVIMTGPQGKSCLVAAGQSWQEAKPVIDPNAGDPL